MDGYLLKVYCLTFFFSFISDGMLKSFGYACFLLLMGFSILYFFIIKFNYLVESQQNHFIPFLHHCLLFIALTILIFCVDVDFFLPIGDSGVLSSILYFFSFYATFLLISCPLYVFIFLIYSIGWY